MKHGGDERYVIVGDDKEGISSFVVNRILELLEREKEERLRGVLLFCPNLASGWEITNRIADQTEFKTRKSGLGLEVADAGIVIHVSDSKIALLGLGFDMVFVLDAQEIRASIKEFNTSVLIAAGTFDHRTVTDNVLQEALLTEPFTQRVLAKKDCPALYLVKDREITLGSSHMLST
jgi:hypothetical protein